jgi:predicted Zn-dependent protease
MSPLRNPLPSARRSSARWTLTGLLVLTACNTAAGVQTETTLAKVLISDNEEKQIGQQVHAQLDQQGVKYVTDPAVTGYVDRVAAPVLAQAAKQRGNMDWHVHVIDDPKQVNAFATPGGHIYVYSALLKNLKTENELAGVLAHESGHIIARHSARAMVDQFGLDALTQLALGKNPGLVGQIAAQLVGTGTMLAHSRAEESEADMLGAQIAAQAGYDPRGLSSFLHQLLASQGKTPEVLKWLSDHPASEDRIAALDQTIAAHGWSGKVDGAPGELAGMQQHLGGTTAPAGQPAPSQPASTGTGMRPGQSQPQQQAPAKPASGGGRPPR